ncbi:Uu.00g024510.m01.CDS01 [Anthostomella pinea]|uniref:Uu.00g024510.m01.CDS01 n=1 Tax=Anthostomella pinea TaxID=933095 RepID=A0AAI8W0B6_9PEZI|nr:Uu.00g024510.m01.CDS01 [Anthostomella pinea]
MAASDSQPLELFGSTEMNDFVIDTALFPAVDRISQDYTHNNLPPGSPQLLAAPPLQSRGHLNGAGAELTTTTGPSCDATPASGSSRGESSPVSGWLGPLHIAAHKGHDKILKLLIQHNPDCNEKDGSNLTPLIHAVIGGYEDVVNTLLQHAARVSEIDLQGRSSLHWAVVHRRDSILRLLLENCHGLGAAVNAYDNHGKTPLHMAIDTGFEEGVQILLRYGADTGLVGRFDKTRMESCEVWAYRRRGISLMALAVSMSLVSAAPERSRPCRTLPGDSDWPSVRAWNALNSTVGGRLIQGVPVAQVCYGIQTEAEATACASLRDSWGLVDPFLSQPVSVVSPYFENNTCTPFVPVDTQSTNDTSLCQLGNMASYAIEVSGVETVVAGLSFAREHNLRLIVKNTGHDYLGGSVGKGSLALWTHNLTDITLMENYTSQYYTGAAFRIGAGVQFTDFSKTAAALGLRVVGGSCPTVGANGGWRQGGGHGPLSSTYGLGADNTLEFEVVTTDGRYLTASPKENSDLFFALAGGGAGNYAVVVSAVVKGHKDSQVAGSRLTVNNNDEDTYWSVVEAWMKHLLVLDTIHGFASEVLITEQSFSLVLATLPGGDKTTMTGALTPFYDTLAQLNVTPVVNETKVQGSYLEHYNEFLGGVEFTRNITVGGRLIPRSLVRDDSALSNLTATFKTMVADSDTAVYLLGYNVTNGVAGVPEGYNAVTPAWRDSLFLINIIIEGQATDDWPKMESDLARANVWQDKLRDFTPGGGAYINEGTFNAPQWKDDYFGGTYDRLLSIKTKYDPNFVLWTRPGAGADLYEERPDGHLCKV